MRLLLQRESVCEELVGWYDYDVDQRYQKEKDTSIEWLLLRWEKSNSFSFI